MRGLLFTGVGIALGLSACGEPSLSFTPPAEPAHWVDQAGHGHAERLTQPFLCGDPDDPTGLAIIPCPDARPPDNFLSCDAMGCHGGFEFTPASEAARHLRGSEGPSCYTCHDELWDDGEDEHEHEDDD